MYDFFSVDYDYGEGVHIHSMCRQIMGCWNWVGHDFVYAKGHTDGSNYAVPPKATMLYAIELPPAGGDTMFASMYDAYETLSPALQAQLGELRALTPAIRSWPSPPRSRA